MVPASIKLATSSPGTAYEPATDVANHNAYATYDISVNNSAGALSAEAVVKASVSGIGATIADYTGLYYRTTTDANATHSSTTWVGGTTGAETGTGWTAVTDGLITLPVGTTHFELSTNVLYDTNVELWESLTFVVAQTYQSAGIENSWYVASNVALADPAGGAGTGGAGGAPTATVTDNVADTVNAATANITYHYVFDRAVTGLTVDDFTVGNGTIAGAGDLTGSDTTYDVTVTPTAGVASGFISVTLKQGAVIDTDGNANFAITNASQAIDTKAPTVAINIVGSSFSDLHNSSLVNFTFSEAPVGFDAADISATNGTISNFAGTGNTYHATFTATDGFSGSGSVTVNTGHFTDAASNANAVTVSNAVAINTTGTVHYVGGANHFTTIQAAIDDSGTVAGDTILVASGTYPENVALNKAVTLAGANHGVDGAAGGRGSESTIQGTVTVTAGATLDGFKVLNTSSSTGTGQYGINVTTLGGAATVQLINNVVWASNANGNDTDRAISLTTAVLGHVVIDGNLISGASAGQYSTASWNRGIWSDGQNASLDITDNTILNSRTAMNLDLFNGATTTVSGNHLTSDGSGISVGLNAVALTMTGIHDNVFTTVDTDFNLGNLPSGKPVSFDLGATRNAAGAGELMVVLGGADNDTLVGTSGPDYLKGNSGNDTITGGGGADALEGNAGNDTFVFAAGSSTATAGHYDSIMDLAAGDQIKLPSAVTGIQSQLDWGATETDLLAGILAAQGVAFGTGNVRLYTLTGDTNAYLLIDNGDGLFGTNDTLIKIVGGDANLSLIVAGLFTV